METLLLVIERGSLADAARQLNITPAAVSQRIQTLEHEIGHELLQRSGRSVRPTEHASAIVEQSRAIIAQVRDLSANGTSEPPVGKLRVGAISSQLKGSLPAVLATFFKQFPQIELLVDHGTSSELYKRLLDDTLDAVVIAEPPFELPKGYQWRRIRSEPLVVLAPPNETLSDPHEILRSRPFIRFDRTQWSGQMANAYLIRNSLHPQDVLELDSIEAIMAMVNAGVGVALVPDWPSIPTTASKVRKIPLHPSAPARTVGLLWSGKSTRIQFISRFVQAMDKTFKP
nr:LysR family transcriptional regulator [Ameyamaea chiangmaiensis]